MSKGYYIVFVHIYRPADGERTEAVNWGKEGNWQRQEEVYFVDRIKKQHTVSATTIFDYGNHKIIKDRTQTATPDVMLDYVRETYPDEFARFMMRITQDKFDKDKRSL